MKDLITNRSIFLLFLFSFFLSSPILFAQKKGKSKPAAKPKVEEAVEEEPVDFKFSEFDVSLSFNSYEEASKNPVNVVKLDLSKQELTAVPPDISKFTNLVVLNLSDNKIEEIGGELKKLRHLQELYLANNKISVFPADLSNLPKLKSLTLSGNNIIVLPTALGEYKSLEMLFLQNNQIEKLPAEIGKLESLRYLYLYGNKLKEIPAEVCNLSELQVLFLQNNEISHLPQDILKLNKMVYFSVDNQRFDKENPIQLINQTFYDKIPVEGLTLNKLKIFYGASNNTGILSAPSNSAAGMSSNTPRTSNIHGTSSSLFNTNYPPGFRPFSMARTVFQVYYFPITGIHWVVSKNFRNRMRFTEIYRIEKRISRYEQKRNPNINRIERESQRRLRLLSKIK